MRKFKWFCCLCLVAMLFAGPVHAVSLSGGNLGYTSFVDGLGFPGLFSDQYLYYYSADRYTDRSGHKRPGKNKSHNLMWLNSFKYIPENPKILGAWPGIDVELPIIMDLHVENSRFTETESNLADLFVGVFLQYPQSMLFGKYPFWQRLELLARFPTGHYDSDSYINAGSNSYALNPYYSFTVFPTEKLEISGRLFYKWTSRNNDPPDTPSPKWTPRAELRHNMPGTHRRGRPYGQTMPLHTRLTGT
jgi:hypothetical protein